MTRLNFCRKIDQKDVDRSYMIINSRTITPLEINILWKDHKILSINSFISLPGQIARPLAVMREGIYIEGLTH